MLGDSVLPVQVTRVNEGYDEEDMDEEMGGQAGDAGETGEGQGHGQPSAAKADAPTVIVLDASSASTQCVEGAGGDDGARAHAVAANMGAQSGEPEAKAGAVQDDTRPEAQQPTSAATAAAEPTPTAAGEPGACEPGAPNPLNPLPAARTAADDNPAI